MLICDLKGGMRMKGIELSLISDECGGFRDILRIVYCTEIVKRIFAEHLDKLCTALIFMQNNLFVWSPDEGVVHRDDFPMKALVNKDMVCELALLSQDENFNS